ncbi:acyltransferase family protein [Brevundimonas sp.]|uniref:acyltransferase family protein n=1 Tax=Brevundimonas sp. TaxID=1871086 RepID=UPI002D72EC44|nr:acyltransferase family protein [Brevundimonas sp.]HYC73591.1 acyltransferase family protein [Brevundimonas sp.]
MGAGGAYYRPEIDGLRAIAVVAVILFHTNLGVATGGYIGVDVFFVISGYLISSIILREVGERRFTFLGFYERRIRRIFPALFVVLAATTAAAWVILPPQHMQTYGQSLVATTAFASNVFFWLKSGYFGGDAELFPLTHMWSLSVEEQYYVFFPFLALIAGWGRPKLLNGLMAAALLVSLALCLYFAPRDQMLAFFMTPMRAWELMFGVFIALHEKSWRPAVARIRFATPLIELAAVAMIVVPIFLYDSSTLFPGVSAIPPVLGTALLILMTRPDTPAGVVLASPGFVLVGLMSYSAYLWHQPLYALSRMQGLTEAGWPAYAALIALTFVLAWLSLKLIEAPFRERRRFTRLQVYAGFFVGSALLVAIGLAAHVRQGFPERFSAETLAVAATGAPSPRRDACHVEGADARGPEQACRYFTGDVRWAVLGDSHGVEIAYALAERLRPAGQGVLHLTFSACQPALTFESDNPGCSRWTRDSVAWLEKDPRITDVVLVYRHSLYLFGDQTKSYPHLPSADPNFLTSLPADEARARYAGSLARIVERLTASGKRVHLVAPFPDLPTHVERYTFKGDPTDPDRVTGTTLQFHRERNAFIRPVLDRLGQMPGVDVLDPADAVCADGRCSSLIGGVSMYFDDNHFSLEGARRFLDLEVRRGGLALPPPAEPANGG